MLRRFLRARSYNMEKATAMWQASLEWRREHEVDDILMTFEFPERDEVLKIMPQGYHKTDKTVRCRAARPAPCSSC